MEYTVIGKIVNTHGIKGEVKILSYSDFDAERYKKGKHVFIEDEGMYIPFTVQSFRMHQGSPLVSFQEAQNINDVEKYKGHLLYMNKADRQKLKDDEYYRDELKGLEVYDEAGSLIGTVLAVEETNAYQTHLRIERDGMSDALIPYIPQFICSVDLDAKKIIVHTEEGLL